jgi:tetratricopeptide (TPR) repeat protein
LTRFSAKIRNRKVKDPVNKATQARAPWLVGAQLALLSLAVGLVPVGGGEQPGRIGIAIIPLRPPPLKAEETRWELIAGDLIRYRLSCVPSVRVLPASSMKFAYRVSGLDRAERVTPDRVRNLGEAVEAAWVVWGDYRVDSEGATINLSITDVKRGQTTEARSPPRTNWQELASWATDSILRTVRVTPSVEESARMNHFFGAKPQALELLCRAIAGNAQGNRGSSFAEALRRAVDADPSFAFARQMLAQILASQGRIDEARAEAKTAVKADPDLAPARIALATVYLSDGLGHLAEQELKEALRIDPDFPDGYIKLGDTLAAKGRWTEANEVLRQVIQVAPYDASTRAKCAITYVQLGDAEAARVELDAAARLSGKDPEAEILLGEGYDLLHDLPKAIEHYDTYIAEAQRQGLRSSELERTKTHASDLRQRFVPHLLEAQSPARFTPPELQDTLRRQLTEEEFRLIVVPFAATEEMTNWAHQVIQDAVDESEKAKRLFQGLACRVTFGQDYRGLTAAEAFAEWRKSRPEMTCQDYTLLYMALARAAGVATFYARIDRDYDSNTVNHACAAVFVSEKALLVDPVYHWFGIPHTGFVVEGDLQAVAAFMACSDDPAREKIAMKLAGGWAIPYFLVEDMRLRRGDVAGAGEVLQAGLRRDANSWVSYMERANVAAAKENWDVAASQLRMCLRLRPDFSQGRFELARVLLAAGALRESRDEFRQYLRKQTTPDGEQAAHRAIRSINEELHD